MTEIRKESWAAESLRTAKKIDTIFIPLDYDYGKNFQGERQGKDGHESSRSKVKRKD